MAQRFQTPNLPFDREINAGCTVGTSILVAAQAYDDRQKSFEVSLSSQRDIALNIVGRIQPGRLTATSRLNDVYSEEVTKNVEIGFNRPFRLVFMVKDHVYEVYMDDVFLFDFVHRVNPIDVRKVHVEGPLIVHEVVFTPSKGPLESSDPPPPYTPSVNSLTGDLQSLNLQQSYGAAPTQPAPLAANNPFASSMPPVGAQNYSNSSTPYPSGAYSSGGTAITANSQLPYPVELEGHPMPQMSPSGSLNNMPSYPSSGVNPFEQKDKPGDYYPGGQQGPLPPKPTPAPPTSLPYPSSSPIPQSTVPLGVPSQPQVATVLPSVNSSGSQPYPSSGSQSYPSGPQSGQQYGSSNPYPPSTTASSSPYPTSYPQGPQYSGPQGPTIYPSGAPSQQYDSYKSDSPGYSGSPGYNPGGSFGYPPAGQPPTTYSAASPYGNVSYSSPYGSSSSTPYQSGYNPTSPYYQAGYSGSSSSSSSSYYGGNQYMQPTYTTSTVVSSTPVYQATPTVQVSSVTVYKTKCDKDKPKLGKLLKKIFRDDCCEDDCHHHHHHC